MVNCKKRAERIAKHVAARIKAGKPIIQKDLENEIATSMQAHQDGIYSDVSEAWGDVLNDMKFRIDMTAPEDQFGCCTGSKDPDGMYCFPMGCGVFSHMCEVADRAPKKNEIGDI